MKTTSNNYFEEYTQFVNDLQNKIMQIQLKYNECQSLIRSDFSKGFIAKEVADRMLAVKINQFVPSMDRMYRLSKADVDFINQYADLDYNGDILASILKKEYLQKADLLEYILKSVKTAHYFESMEPTSRRLRIKTDLISNFNRRISMLRSKALNMLKIHGESAKYTAAYQQLQAEIEKCSNTIPCFDKVMDYDDATLRKLIESFYDIDYSYYDWYLNMELKSLKETDKLYTEHSQTMSTVNSYGEDLVENQSKTADLSKSLSNLNNKLMSFLTSLTTFDMTPYEEAQPKVSSFFKKNRKSLDNKDILSKMFISLVSLPGVADYLQETYAKDGESLELNDCFNQFFNTIYGEETTYVNLTKFLLSFQKELVQFYKNKIEKQQQELASQIKVSGGINVALVNGIKKGYNQALLQEKAFNATTYSQSYALEGFSDEELERMYYSLKSILNLGYGLSTKNNELLSKKF